MPLRMGGGRSDACAIYETLRDSMGSAHSKDDSTLANRERRCMALAIARAKAHQTRGAMQSLPETATDYLPRWERWLQVPVDTTSPAHLRRAVCTGALAGNLPPTEDNIASACSTALGGESVRVTTGRVPVAQMWAASFFRPALSEVLGAGQLRAGLHYVYGVNEVPMDPSTGYDVAIYVDAPLSITLAADGSAISVGGYGIPLTFRYYLSHAPGSTDASWVADGNGGPITLGAYPTERPDRNQQHYAIIVSDSTAANDASLAKLHTVLGPMLPAEATYDIVGSQPFVLGPAGSPLGRGGL
jgi:hypothetical protein